MFENKMVEGIYYSRFAASWRNVTGDDGSMNHRKVGWKFRAWLRSLVINDRHLTEEEIWDIYNLATNGKLELESDARKFLALPEKEQQKFDV